MPRLLVSVRDASEAMEAVAGGADIVDVKEPAHGPLGRAEPDTWAAVRAVVPAGTAVSVALGELVEWRDGVAPESSAWRGLAFRKVGPARAGGRWATDFRRLRETLGPGPDWVAVAYADWRKAGAPSPESVLEEAVRAGCAGCLVDTWEKGRPARVLREPDSWRRYIERARSAGLTVALAGGLDTRAVATVREWAPDIIAVRGAACSGGDRGGTIRAARVAELRQALGPVGFPGRVASA